MSLKTTIDNYNLAEQMYFEIDDIFNKHQEGNVHPAKIDFSIDQTILKIKKLLRVLDKVNVNDLSEKYDEKVIEDVSHNIQFFYEAANYIEKTLLGEKYYDDLLPAVKMYIEHMNLPDYEYKQYAGDENELSRKFTSMLVHKNNIETFENHIKRIILGTMSDKEFQKIYDTNKFKMISKKNKFQSYNSFKKEN
jgi:hypothetical protein